MLDYIGCANIYQYNNNIYDEYASFCGLWLHDYYLNGNWLAELM